jgi:hypothetical protein
MSVGVPWIANENDGREVTTVNVCGGVKSDSFYLRLAILEETAGNRFQSVQAPLFTRELSTLG